MLLHIFLLLCYINFVYPNCESTNKPKETNWEQKLKEDLLCYNIKEPPNKNYTTVVAHFTLSTFNFEDNEELFYTYHWIFFTWHDSRLKWIPSEYDDIGSLIVHSTEIWTPISNVKNIKSLNEDTDIVYYSLFCKISSDGLVSCIPRTLQETVCNSRLENWPYDTQNCTFIFSFRKGFNNAFLTFNSTRGISTLGAEYGNGWYIVNYETSEKHSDTDTELYITYIVERRALGLVCMIVIPAVIVTVLTMTSLFLDVTDNNRIFIVMFSLLGHFYLLQAISENLPHHGPDTPKVLIFIRSSIFITTVGALLTLVLKTIKKTTLNPPLWVIIINEYGSKKYINYLIFPKVQDQPNDSTENRPLIHWSQLTSIVNTILIYSLFLTYQILIIKYIPQSPTIIYTE